MKPVTVSTTVDRPREDVYEIAFEQVPPAERLLAQRALDRLRDLLAERPAARSAA